MATPGVRIYGSHGYLQIDDRYRNSVLKSKGSATCNILDTGSIARYNANVAVTSNGFPQIAIRSAHLVGRIAYTQSGSTWTFVFTSNTSGATFDWYHYDVPDNTPLSGVPGFQIRKLGGGPIVFRSDLKPQRIVDKRAAGSAAYTYPAGKTYAAIQTAPGFSFIEVAPAGKGSGSYRSWCAGCSWSGEQISTPWAFAGAIQVDQFTSGSVSQTVQPPAPDFIVCDVTGH